MSLEKRNLSLQEVSQPVRKTEFDPMPCRYWDFPTHPAPGYSLGNGGTDHTWSLPSRSLPTKGRNIGPASQMEPPRLGVRLSEQNTAPPSGAPTPGPSGMLREGGMGLPLTSHVSLDKLFEL